MNTTVGKVEKLEALLARVQRNRTQPRNGAGRSQDFAQEASFDDAPSLAPAVQQPPVPRPPVRSTTEPIGQAQGSATSSRSARTPLEQAVENKLERPSTHPHLQAVPSPQSSAQAAAPVPQPVAFSRAGADEPSSVIDPPSPVASRGVGQVVSKQPLIGAQTFGDLLRRSLSLRPR